MATTSPARPPARRLSFGSLVFWLPFIGVNVAGFRNALAPEPELEGQARAVACAAAAPAARPAAATSPAASSAHSAASTPQGGKPDSPAPPCGLQTTLRETGPFGRAFGFERPKTSTRLQVQCHREYLVLGDYRCSMAP